MDRPPDELLPSSQAPLNVHEQEIADIDDFITREMQTRMARRAGWRQLEICFKWRKVVEYLEARGKGEEGDAGLVARLRNAVQQDGLPHLEYDTDTARILRLGLEGSPEDL